LKPVIPDRLEVASPEPSTKRGALAALSLCMLLASLGTSIANVALPSFTQAFGASFQDVQWIVLGYLLTSTALMVGVGRLGDVVGRRKLLLSGVAVFTLAALLSGIAPTLSVLIAFRATQGAGAAIMMALSLALVTDTVSKASMGRAMGLLGAASAIGTAMGPALGGFLIAAAGWRSIFLIGVPLGVLTLLFTRYVPDDRARAAPEASGFDIAGMLLLAATLSAYALAMTLGRGNFGSANVALLIALLIGLGLFLLVESRAASPLIRLAALRDPGLGAGLLMSLLVSAVMMTTLLVGPFYLSGALNLQPVHVGLIVSVGPVVVALTGVPAGRIADRLGARAVVAAGLVVMTAGCTLLAMMPEAAGVTGYVAPLVIVTAGYALFQTANNTAVMADVAAGRRGVVSGLLNLSRNLGLITGASAMGAVFALGAAETPLTSAGAAAIAGGTRISFAVAAILVAIAVMIAMASMARDFWRPQDRR
jgi:MFS family permease